MGDQTQSVFRTEAQRRFPAATIIGDGAYGVVLNDGRITVELFPTSGEAKRFAGTGLRVVYFGPKVEPQKPRWWED